MDWILANWQGLLGGGSITTVITYLTNRRTAKADILTRAEDIYESLFEHIKTSNDDLKETNKTYLEDIKYLRGQIDGVQKQLNEMNIAYAKEVEKSQNWEKLHRELLQKYNELEKKHNDLQKEFDNYKINNNLKHI